MNNEEIALWAAKSPKKFTHEDFNNAENVTELQTNAELYAKNYEGSFPFMEDMHKKANASTKFSNGQLAAILNCAQKEGKNLKAAAKEATKLIPTNEPLPTINSLEDATKAIHDLEVKIKDFGSSPVGNQLKQALSDSKAEEEELYEEFQKRMKEIRDRQAEAAAELSNLQHYLHSLEGNLDYSQKKYAELLKLQAAQEKLEELNATLTELRQKFAWSENIMPFQWADVVFIINAFVSGRKGVLNANDMGLGKTFETGAILDLITILFEEENHRTPHVLWLTKKSLIDTTRRELLRWNQDRKIIPIKSIPDKKVKEMMIELAIQNQAWIVTNYDSLNTTTILQNFEFDIVVMDEVHKVKGGANSRPTQVFTNTFNVCQKAKFVLPLTGSPIQNHPKEMWCYLNIFDPIRFPSASRFEREFCYGYGEYDENGNPLIKISWDSLIEKALVGRVIRKSKEEVLTDLPDKIREFRYLEMEGKQLEIYTQLRTSFFVWLDEQKSQALSATSILAQLTRLRQAAVLPSGISYKSEETGEKISLDCNESIKIDEAMEIIAELNSMGEQVVVFSSQFNEPLYELGRRIDSELGIKWETLTGEAQGNIDPIQERFQSGETRVLLVNSKSGGEGLNLQKSDQWEGGSNHAIFLDLWWNPKFNEQCEDRLHRKGQKDNVTCFILQCDSSVDQFIAQKLEQKEAMIDGIMERDEIRTASEWAEALKEVL